MSWVQAFQKHLKSKLPVFVGLVKNDLKSHIGQDFIYVDRGYWDRSQKYRIIRGNLHLTTLLERPADRLEGSELRPWKKGGSFVVVIPPSPFQIAVVPSAADWVKNLNLQTDREIRVKTNKELPFEAYLQGCHAVVSYGSVAAVKAAMWGYPVLSGPLCPATPISCEDIEKPVLKDREALLRSLSYAQWTAEEAMALNLDDYQYSCG